MKKLITVLLAFTMVLGLGASCSFADAPPIYTTSATEKIDKNLQTRVIITTDAEVDDMNSFLMLLLWANELDIDGIVYSSSSYHFNGDGKGTTQGDANPNALCESRTVRGVDPKTLTEWRPMDLNWFQDVIANDYAADYEYLSQNDPNYPSPEELLEVVKIGNVEFEGDVRFPSEGSEWIKECILDDDERTLYIENWGGVNTTVRALMSIAEEYQDTEEWEDIQSKVLNKVILQSAGQDRSYKDNKIDELFPGLRQIGGTGLSLGYFRASEAPEYVLAYFQAPWLTENLKFNHGKLMEHMYLLGDGQILYGEIDEYQYGLVTYIDWESVGLSGFPRMDYNQYDWLAVTDAPRWIALVPVGLRGLENGNLGSWAGRISLNGTPQNAKESYEEFNYMTGKMEKGFSAVRFEEDLLQDWAARAEWAVHPYEECNHAPVVRAEDLDLDAAPGTTVELNAIITDPDEDELKIKWWVYEEASEYSGEMKGLHTWYEDTASTRFTVPEDAQIGDYFTIVLEVQDKAEKPMTRYQEVLVHTNYVERDNPFTDLSKEDPWYDAVLNCYDAGILDAGDGIFNADGTITYEEIVDIFKNAERTRAQIEVPEGHEGSEEVTRIEFAKMVIDAMLLTSTFRGQEFADIPEGSEDYETAILISAPGYMLPDEDGNFRPDELINRSDVFIALDPALAQKPHIAF